MLLLFGYLERDSRVANIAIMPASPYSKKVQVLMGRHNLVRGRLNQQFLLACQSRGELLESDLYLTVVTHGKVWVKSLTLLKERANPWGNSDCHSSSCTAMVTVTVELVEEMHKRWSVSMKVAKCLVI